MRDAILITEEDYQQLSRLVQGWRGGGSDAQHLDELREELDRAEILGSGQAVPADIVTMNCEVRLADLDSGDTRQYRLTYPANAHGGNALSVLAPIGTAILGYRTGSVIEWRVPKGIRRLEVVEVTQPQSSTHPGEAQAA